MSSPAVLATFRAQPVVTSVLDMLAFSDFVSFSQLSPFTRRIAKRRFRERLVKLVGSFLCNGEGGFIEWQAAFTNLMSLAKETDSVLMGSAILQLLTLRGEEELRRLRNLNILIPFSTVLQWRRLFQQQLGFRLVGDEAVPEFLSQSCSSCLKFSKGTSFVLCTVARPANMLRALVAARATSQMNIITGNCVLSFYPSLTVRRLSLLGWPAQAMGATTYEAMTGRQPPLGDVVRYGDGSEWSEPCGRECRRLMRLSTGYKGVGKFFWTDDSDSSIAYESESVLWFLAMTCVNPTCPE
ncbi:hypothetical protein R3P38DRAFT_3196018 [Favolaschia claudopus]|uniref:F-box protein n=1 Tax=Favolaschia claudopus TaxID=2862362 RepID=A0AAW0B9G3_9AGAR